MARQPSTPLDLAAPRRTLTLTLRAALLTAAVAALTACSDPTAPAPAPDAGRPHAGRNTGQNGADDVTAQGRNIGQTGGEDIMALGGVGSIDPGGGGSDR